MLASLTGLSILLASPSPTIGPQSEGVTVRKLNPTLPAQRQVLDFAASGDGTRVAYRSDQDADEVYELWGVDLASGAVLKLSGATIGAGDVQPGYLLTRDGSRVVFRADREQDERFELYATDGSALVKLNGPLVAGGDVHEGFQLSADGLHVVYLADQGLDQRTELYSARLDGSAPALRLDGALGADRDVREFRLSADGATVVYLSDERIDDQDELFAVPTAGGPAALPLDTPSPGAFVRTGGYAIAPDDSSVAWGVTAGGSTTLLVAPIDAGSAPLSLDVVATEHLATVGYTPDGSRVVYGYSGLIHSAPVDGSTAALTLTTISEPGFQIAADGRVLYRIFAFPSGVWLMSRPADASLPAAAVESSAGIVAPDFRITPAGDRVLYRGGLPAGLMSAPTDGSRPGLRLGARPPDSGPQPAFSLEARERWVFSRADQDGDGRTEIAGALADFGGTPRVMSPLPVPLGEVLELQALRGPTGVGVLFRADLDTNDVFELYLATFEAAGARPSAGPTSSTTRSL